MEHCNHSWRESAACSHVAVQIFFPPTDFEGEEAKAICRTCPVREPCLEAALEANEQFGIWGGLTTTERRVLVVRRRRAELVSA
jgi:WhiB family redox-sensing transcriptional regulator